LTLHQKNFTEQDIPVLTSTKGKKDYDFDSDYINNLLADGCSYSMGDKVFIALLQLHHIKRVSSRRAV
jgi:hypothetical protein